MSKKVLIVEDEYIVANDLQLMLEKANYTVCGIADSVPEAQAIIKRMHPELVLLDIQLKGHLSGIDLARQLRHQQIAFVYLSANSSQRVLEEAKTTDPYGFLVKPFRAKDLLVAMDIAWYRFEKARELPAKKIEEKTEKIQVKDIVGNSPALLNLLDQAARVAPTDTSVLIMGESGTGKEQIAKCIHDLSDRKSRPMVKVNCAALPASLIESELFGHEKGAFTGAFEKRIGKFEQAAGSTIFLDEIGEMPLEMQVKLLRVLQEKEIERIGGRSTIKVDVRIIAATNRNLEKEIGEGRFRLDLYYRLNVFPLTLPPLRDRKEDIPALAYYFTDRYARKIGKQVMDISPRVLKELVEYHWPGNIRELEHLLERSILLNNGNMIKEIYLPQSGKTHTDPVSLALENQVKTIEENERDHILNVLKKCRGKIWGSGGAAELLGVPPTTLNSKMKKLGIRKEFF